MEKMGQCILNELVSFVARLLFYTPLKFKTILSFRASGLPAPNLTSL